MPAIQKFGDLSTYVSQENSFYYTQWWHSYTKSLQEAPIDDYSFDQNLLFLAPYLTGETTLPGEEGATKHSESAEEGQADETFKSNEVDEEIEPEFKHRRRSSAKRKRVEEEEDQREGRVESKDSVQKSDVAVTSDKKTPSKKRSKRKSVDVFTPTNSKQISDDSSFLQIIFSSPDQNSTTKRKKGELKTSKHQGEETSFDFVNFTGEGVAVTPDTQQDLSEKRSKNEASAITLVSVPRNKGKPKTTKLTPDASPVAVTSFPALTSEPTAETSFVEVTQFVQEITEISDQEEEEEDEATAITEVTIPKQTGLSNGNPNSKSLQWQGLTFPNRFLPRNCQFNSKERSTASKFKRNLNL